ncbi:MULTISPECIES: leucine--tRNA ligase [unclassified Neochlamydia]|uniref:leucine--tRNA ligase n=1 Tax=unclassified Neochlamydia TaxID=2643326 RepID=UPI001BC9FFFA|nr:MULTISPECIES: leucine--tRNA ligase [unclassified Neochlamydia]MBS4171117.1 Leucine--tRNA ligase [Neochlamydia sp. AcF95]
MKYDHKKIEAKWQKFWSDNKTFKAEIDPSKPKYYILDMFPYPSGAGLHVGHLIGYTATDILARYKRQKGYNVLHPMGWDSFGLPAEQYAIRTGTHPAETTKYNVLNFKRQLSRVGYSYDWDREISTSDPSYFKWTQWIFTLLYERGLAYEAEMMVNYCPALGTVLANEEIENGFSKEGGHPVERRPLRQWILKITAYAERLIKDLELVDWPESLKKLQINWIGKSEGASIRFPIKNSDCCLEVYTTRPETLFGVTYLVLAPEHPLVSKITSKTQQACTAEYQKTAASKTDLERTDLNKNKSGVFIGAYAINPANGKDIPVWISDYVIPGYGTGAIMSVPAHDERDFEFAKKFDLPLVYVYNVHPEDSMVYQAVTEESVCIHSENEEISLNGLKQAEATKKIIEWLERKGIGKSTVTYKLRDWLFSRQRYWGEPFPILHFEDGTKRVLEIDELPLTLPAVSNYKPLGDGQSPLGKVEDWINIHDSKTGKKARRETNTMPNWAGSCWYYLRFCDPHNDQQAWGQEAEKYWGPVDMYVGGVEHAVLHLLYARFWHKVLFDCGYVSFCEPFKALRNQGLMVARSYQNSLGAYVAPEDVIEREGHYFHRQSGEELKSQIDKMSKSKLNGVSPDDVIEEYGTDALRLYEMFLGPLDKEKVWSSEAVSGCRRFLVRFYEMATSDKLTYEDSEEAFKLGHRLVHGVEKDIEALQFNTAIAKMMEFINDFTRLPLYPRSVVKMATQALMPFAPHLAEEIWELLDCKEALSFAPFPQINENYLVDSHVTYIVQINGKLRARLTLPIDISQEAILEAAEKNPLVTKHLEGQTVQKIIFVPNKLLNIVIG